MRTPLAVFTADNHLRPNTWSKHPDLRGDSYVSFTAIVDYCLQHALPLFLLGDTFDATAPPADAVAFFCEQVDRMAEARLAVYFIKGNHDDSATAWPSVHKHCTYADHRLIWLGGFCLYGLDFRPAGQLKTTLANIPVTAGSSIDILLTHQSWQEIQRVGHTDGSFNDIPLVALGQQAPLLITGDYHIHGRFTAKTEAGHDVVAFSPGSTSMQKLNEEPIKRFYVMMTEGRQIDMESVLLPTREFHGFECRTADDFEQVLTAIRAYDAADANKFLRRTMPADIQKPILRVKFNDSIPEAYSRLVAIAGDRFHLFDEPHHVTEQVVVDVNATPEGAFESLITAIGQLSAPGSEQYNGARRLLEAEDPRAELATMFREYLIRHGQTQSG